jgi:hypothetical protein
MKKEHVVDVPYCAKCKGLTFIYERSRTAYGIATMAYSDDGYEEIRYYECKDSKSFDSYCRKCRTVLNNYIEIPLSIFQRLLKLDIDIFELDIGEKAPDEITLKKLKDLLFNQFI